MRFLTALALTTSVVGVCAAKGDPPRVRLPIPSGPMNEIIPGYLLVKLSPEVAASAAERTLSGRSIPSAIATYQFQSRIGQTGWTMWRIPSFEDPKATAKRIRRTAGILEAQPLNRIYPLLQSPNDGDWNVQETDESLVLNFGEDPVSFRRLWHLDDTNAMAAWEVYPGTWYTTTTKPKTGPLIAVIDTGCDMNHPDFKNAGGTSTDVAQGGQLAKGYSAQFQFGELVNGGDPEDTQGHGTHVAGLALAAGNNSSYAEHGVIGTGYNGRGMILRVFDESGSGSDADAAAAMFYAADKGADIINLSLGTTNFSQLFQDAVTYCWQKGVLIVAAGNENGSGGGDLGPIYPAASSGVLAVSANGPYGQPAATTYSGFGPYVDIAAPGGDLVQSSDYYLIQFVYSTAVRGPSALAENTALYPPYTPQYSYLAGTSMATPLVTGAASLFYGKNGLKRSQGYANVRAYRALQKGAAGVLGAPYGGWEYYQGYGSLDAWSTLTDYDPREALVGAMEGMVYANATPIANASIRAQKLTGGTTFSTTTRADGGYRFEGLTPGIYNVWTAPFGNYKSKRVVVRAGSDYSGFDFWCGPYTVDLTAPTIGRVAVAQVSESAITVDQWGYDTESAIDQIDVRIGSTPGSTDLLGPTELVTDVAKGWLQANAAFVPGQTYYLTMTYTNGAGLATTSTVPFSRTVVSADSQYDGAVIPAVTMYAGNTYTVKLRFKNTGSKAWKASLGAQLVAVDAATGENFGVSTVSMATGATVGPGVIRPFTMQITPARGGVYDFKWRLMQSGKYFGEVSQNAPLTIRP